jgi:hypothetical protein
VAFLYWHIARIEAELGHGQAARQALAEGNRFIEMALREAPAGTFRRGLWESWSALRTSHIQQILGDNASARDMSATAVRLLGAAKPENEVQKRFLMQWLSDAHAVNAAANYRLREVATAEASARRAAEMLAQVPANNRIQEIGKAEVEILHALTLARLGRLVDARASLVPPARFFASLPRGDGVDWIQLRVAELRLAQALANPGESRTHLTEATRLLDGLSPEMQRTSTVKQVRSEVVSETAARR